MIKKLQIKSIFEIPKTAPAILLANFNCAKLMTFSSIFPTTKTITTIAIKIIEKEITGSYLSLIYVFTQSEIKSEKCIPPQIPKTKARMPAASIIAPLVKPLNPAKGIENEAQKTGKGIVDGYHKTYNSNKDILMDGEFKNGKLFNGKHYIYDEYGLLEKIEVYKNGKYIGNGVVE